MKLILLLGAGVSKPSGLPTAAELTESVLRGIYHDDGRGVFRRGRHQDSNLRTSDVTPRIRRLLHLLREHDARDIKRVGYYPVAGGFRSSGAIYRGTTTYEDLFFLCQQISLWNIGLSDNSLTTTFMEHIERRAHGLLVGRSIKARMCDLATLGQLACYFIESVVAETLRKEYSAGFDLILELATESRIEQLNIVTLNHDTLVEQFLALQGVDFADGFGEPDGDVRWWADVPYDAPGARVRIFKLHGSVNWYSFLTEGASRSAILLGADPDTAQDGMKKALVPQFRRPSFLSGINKTVSYQRGIYTDIHFRFCDLLRKCGRIVMSGYGWGDTAISFQLDTWLDRSKRNTIILLHEKSEKLTERSLIMASGYSGRVRSGQLVCVEKWLSDVTLREIEGPLFSVPGRADH